MKILEEKAWELRKIKLAELEKERKEIRKQLNEISKEIHKLQVGIIHHNERKKVIK